MIIRVRVARAHTQKKHKEKDEYEILRRVCSSRAV